MTESTIRDWLSDYASLGETELHTFATGLSGNKDLLQALHTVFKERTRYQELIDPVCKQLLSFYRSNEVELKYFVMQFLPTFIFIYLNAVAHSDKKSCLGVETLLIAIYNLEVVDELGQPVVISYRFPSLAQASIYHEPMSLAPASLTERSLKRLEECNTNLVRWGPLPQTEVLNAQNRLTVMMALLSVYNRHLSLLPKPALSQLCKVTSKLVTQGFSKLGHQKRSSYGSDTSFVPRVLPRIPVSAPFLLQLLHGVYFAITYPCDLVQLPHLLTVLTPTFYCHFSRFNDNAYIGTQALEDIYQRAVHELYTDVMLVAGAIKNSLNVNPSGQPSDGPMGISVALTPSNATSTVAKSMITNASFRTKKLPDDIPIQEDDKNLSAISEEKEEEPEHRSVSRKSLPKLSALPGLKKKDKDKDKDKEKCQNGGKDIEKSKKVEKRKKKDDSISNSNRNSLVNGETEEDLSLPDMPRLLLNEDNEDPLDDVEEEEDLILSRSRSSSQRRSSTDNFHTTSV